MKLSEFIPQEVDLLSKRHGIQAASETERRLRELLTNEGDAELDDEFVAMSLGWGKTVRDYNEATQKVYWAIFDATLAVLSRRS